MPCREPFDDPAWLFKPKSDGHCGLLYLPRRARHFRLEVGNTLKRLQELRY
jgi:hypothetical protein